MTVCMYLCQLMDQNNNIDMRLGNGYLYECIVSHSRIINIMPKYAESDDISDVVEIFRKL